MIVCIKCSLAKFLSNNFIFFLQFNFGHVIEQLDLWLDSEYVPSEEDFSRLGAGIGSVLSNANSSALESVELEQHSNGARMEIISFDANERSKKCLSAFDTVSAIIFCLPASDYDCYVDSESKFAKYRKRKMLFSPKISTFLSNILKF